MSKKYGTIKGKEKKIPERELIYGRFYLINEEKCLYGKVNDDGIFTGRREERCSQDRTLDQQMITLRGPDPL